MEHTRGTIKEIVLTFLVLDLLLHILDGVRALHLEGDGLAGQCLDEDLHATTQTQHQVQGTLLLDVVVSESATVLQLLAGEDQTLLVRGDTCRDRKRSVARQNNSSPICSSYVA